MCCATSTYIVCVCMARSFLLDSIRHNYPRPSPLLLLSHLRAVCFLNRTFLSLSEFFHLLTTITTRNLRETEGERVERVLAVSAMIASF